MANIKGMATKAATKSKVLWKQATVAVAAFLVSATGCDSGGLKGCSQDDKDNSAAVVQSQNDTPSETNPGNQTPAIPNAPHLTGPAIFLGQNRIVLTFSEDVAVNSASAADFQLPVSGDTLDNGLVIAGPKSNQVTITLGQNFSLKTRGEFSSENLSVNNSSGIDLSPTLSADAIESVSTGVDAVSYQPVDILPGFTEGLSGLGYRFTEAIAVGDLDSDGTLDVVVGKGALYANETYLQKGPINNPYQLRQTFGNMTDTLDIALGDFDGDGDLDLLEANMWSINRIRLNNGKGVFLSGIQFGGNQSVSTSLGVADFDRDGDLDVVVGNAQGNPNTVWQNDGSGSGNFLGTSAMNFLGSRNTEAIAVGDINRDGYPDIVTGNCGEPNAIWINNADTPWTGFSYFGSLSENGKTQDVKLADLDQDGDLDLVVANQGEEANSVWKNDGTGNFGASAAFTFGENKTYHLAIADLDGDGDLDVATGNFLQPNRIWLNDGTGSLFDSTQLLGAGSTRSIVARDMDQDGDLDLVTGNYDFEFTRIWNGSLSPSWGKAFLTDSGHSLGEGKTTSMARGDLNGDGAIDIVSGNNQGQPNRSWINDGKGSFDETPFETFGEGKTSSLLLGDMDGDGDLDLVEGNQGAENLVRLNDGTGLFSSSVSFGLTSSITMALALGDVDGDGDLDVVEGNSNNLDNRVWLNDGSGTVFTDSGYSIGVGNTESLTLGDLNGDGKIDLVIGNLNQAIEVWTNSGITGSGWSGFVNSNQMLGTYAAKAIILGDVNKDGALDLVVGDDGSYGVTIWVNDGTGAGSFLGTAPFVTLPAYGVRSLDLGDWDADGDLDLLIGRWNQSNAIWENDGTGINQFYGVTPAKSFGDPQATSDVRFCDLDREGDLDVVEGIWNTGNKIWINR